MAIIGERLRELRTEQGLTQTDLASKVGVTTTIISNIERGYSGAKSSIIDSLAERSCLQTDLRSEIGNCATEICIEPFDSLREYRQLCFGAFRYEIIGEVFLFVKP